MAVFCVLTLLAGTAQWLTRKTHVVLFEDRIVFCRWYGSGALLKSQVSRVHARRHRPDWQLSVAVTDGIMVTPTERGLPALHIPLEDLESDGQLELWLHEAARRTRFEIQEF